MRSEKKIQHVLLFFEVSSQVYAHVHLCGGVVHGSSACSSVCVFECMSALELQEHSTQLTFFFNVSSGDQIYAFMHTWQELTD